MKPPQPLNGKEDAVRKHLWARKTIRLTAIADTDNAKADELRQWREEIEADHAGYLWRGMGSAITSQEPLLRLFHRLCQRLPDKTRSTVCFPPESEIGQYLARGAEEGLRPGRQAPKVNAVPPGIEAYSPPQWQQ